MRKSNRRPHRYGSSHLGTVRLHEIDSVENYLLVDVSDRGSLIVTISGEEILTILFDEQRTSELNKTIRKGAQMLRGDSDEWGFVGSVEYSICDWEGSRFSGFQSHLAVEARKGEICLRVMNHPFTNNRDQSILLNEAAVGRILALLKESGNYLKGIGNHHAPEYEPRDMIGRLVQILLNELESGRCPMFPPASIRKVVLGQYGKPNFIIGFISPVTVTTPEDEQEARFTGLNTAVLRPHGYEDRIEALLEKNPRFDSFEIGLWKLRDCADVSNLELLRRGIELETWGSGYGEVRLYIPGKRFRPKFNHPSRWRRRLNRTKARDI